MRRRHLPFSWHVLLVTLTFLLSRLWAWHTGLRMDARGLDWYYQYLPLDLLRDRLLESVFYLHSQPPGYNLLLGLGLKIFSNHVALAFHVLHVGLGLTALLSLLGLLRGLGATPWNATALTTMFAVLPSTLLYEHWLFYEYLVMALLIVAAAAFRDFALTRRAASGMVFFGAAASLILVRSVFQLVWLLPLAGLLLWVMPWKRVVRCGALAILVVMLVYVKGWIVFRLPTTSSWIGMNLARATVFRLDQSTRDQLADAGFLHGISRVDRFASLDRYAPFIALSPPTGIPALDRPMKATGMPNFNAASYIDISRDFLTDAFWVIRNRPETYVRSVAAAAGLLLRPSTDYWAFRGGNRQLIAGYDAAVNRWWWLSRPAWQGFSLTLFVLYAVAATRVLWLIWRLATSRRSPHPVELTVLAIGFTVAYVVAVSVLTEVGDNQRMRFALDPLVLALLVFRRDVPPGTH